MVAKTLEILRVLTDHELDTVNKYCSVGNYSVKKTAELLETQEREIKNIINRPPVRAEIERRQEALKKKFKLTEVDILNKLWEEANNCEKGSNHNARITALVWIGKHLGMWQEKKQEESNSYTYNIVNYDSGIKPEQLEKIIPTNEEVVEEGLPNVSLTTYS
jgi:hypothetical protein